MMVLGLEDILFLRGLMVLELEDILFLRGMMVLGLEDVSPQAQRHEGPGVGVSFS